MPAPVRDRRVVDQRWCWWSWNHCHYLGHRRALEVVAPGGLSSSKRLVGVFSPVVEPPPPDLAIRDTNDLHRRAVRPEPVSHDRLSSTIAFHRPFEKLQRHRAIPPFRRENFEHLALVIHSPPEVVGLAIDPHKHFIKVPAPVRMRTM